MDFQEQARLHSQIRDALSTAVAERRTVDVAALKSDRLCETGCWLHDEGRKRWAGNHAFLGLLEAHRDFHAAVGQVADLINREQFAEAQRSLRNGGAFADALVVLTGSFRRMKAASETLAA
jgi:hypothetical protein